MIRFLILLFAFAFMLQSGRGQLQYATPAPSGFINSKILFTDSQTGYILNTNGDFIRTFNRGATWEIVHNFYAAKAFDIHDSTGVVVAYNAVYISNDKGNTWKKVNVSFTDSYIGVNVIGRDTLVMAGNNKIYKSFNQGQTWQITDLGNIIIKSFQFVTATVGYVGKSNTSLLKTSDGGQTWQELLKTGFGSNAFTAIRFLNTDTGYAYRQTDTMYKTTNGGATWQRTFMPGGMNDIYFPTTAVGYAAGDGGAISRTTDGGTTWNYLPQSGNFINSSVYFLSADTGFIVGYWGKILKTVNSGQTWQSNTITNNTMRALAFPHGSNGYAATDYNVYKTTNSGQSWNTLALTLGQSSNPGSFRFAKFFTADTGLLAASTPARIFKTNNGGQTWRTILFNWGYGTYDECSSLSFINDSTGYALCSYSGGFGLFKTKDRGETWQKVDSNKTGTPNYQKICFVNERTAYAAKGYELYRTNDSAKTWTLLYTNDYIITALDFTSARNGCIGAVGVKRTTDSGRTWVSSISVYSNNIYDLKFQTPAIGYFTSVRIGSPALYQTQDSGRNWIAKYLTAAACSTITFYRDTLVYMGGAYGTVASVPTDTTYTSVSSCQGDRFTFYADLLANNSSFDAFQWQVDTGYGFINVQDNEIYSGANSPQLTLNNPSC